MERYKAMLEARCPSCTAIKMEGIWIRRVLLSMLAMFFPGGLKKELCGDCDHDRERFFH